MSIKLTLEGGRHVLCTEAISGVESEEELQQLFDGDCYYDIKTGYIETDGAEASDESVSVVCAKWIDKEPDTSFHCHVLDRMNVEGISAVFSWAEGETDEAMIVSTIGDYYQGFQAAVNNQINLDGLEFVFGNGFCLDTLFNLIFREIVREYLREHELY